MTNYKHLQAWKKSVRLVKDIYILVKSYPREEQFAVAAQTKRAFISGLCNIAEGAGRNQKKMQSGFCILPGVRFMNWKPY